MTGQTRLRRLAMALALALMVAALVATEGASPRQPDETSRCPVCGMLVARHLDWLAQIVPAEEAEDEALFFDGAKDLFRFLLDPDRQAAGEAARETDAAFVTSYYDRKPIRAREAFFVIGSDVLGPMGAELIPHPTREAAEEFLRDHDGSAVLGYDEITRETLSLLE